MEFFDLVIPDSRHMNPGCIKNTREAEIIIHNMSALFIFMSHLVSYWAEHRVAGAGPGNGPDSKDGASVVKVL
jgi:hypothetical protein